MTPSHSVVWLDHLNAVVICFDGTGHNARNIKSSGESHLHHRRGSVGGGHALADTRFFESISECLKGVPEVLVAGPGNAKLEFIKFVHKHHHELVEHLVGVETVDHPTEGQLLKFAKDYFLAADRMRPGTGISMPPK